MIIIKLFLIALGGAATFLAAYAVEADTADAKRGDPEVMAVRMREKFEKRRSEEKKRWGEIEDLGKKYRASSDEQEQLSLKTEVEKKCGGIYDERLQFGRQHLARLKKRLAFLEAEQAKRESMREEAVAFRVKFVLSGEKMMPPPPPKKGRHSDVRSDRWDKEAAD